MHLQKLKYYLGLIPGPNADRCLRLLTDYEARICEAPGSSIKHQAWQGGYVGHLVECLDIGKKTYGALSEIRALPFAFEDAIPVVFFHDLEKVFKYTEPKIRFENDREKHEFVRKMMDEYGIEFTDEQHNALDYIHGEGDEHCSDRRIQGPLTAFCHCLDTLSARVWFDHPK